MAWWNGPVLILIGAIPFALLSWLTGHWAFVVGGALAFASYYCFYEYIHWCMHLPKARRVEKPWWFRRLNGHHLLHHRYMHKNFNVVLPIADLCLGTFMARAKTHFAQATGPFGAEHAAAGLISGRKENAGVSRSGLLKITHTRLIP